jgi:hypothetical protein
VRVAVPAGAAGLSIGLAYEPPDAILDLGLFGPGPLDGPAAAFRGWSGSERSQVFVSDRWATPGYLAGPIEPGDWHLVLGLVHLPRGGCTYRVTVDVLAPEHEALARDPDAARAEPARSSGRPAQPWFDGLGGDRSPWWPGDLHCHTVHSDGQLRVDELAAAARSAGLSFAFVSDHNTVSHWASLATAGSRHGVQLHEAQEVTTPIGHLGALGTTGWADFRITDESGMRDAALHIAADGGFSVRNHPFAVAAGSEWRIGRAGTDAIEVWNGPWAPGGNDRAMAMWVRELAGGNDPIAVGGSDLHGVGGAWFGTPVSWIQAPDPRRASVLDGLRRGRVLLTRDLNGPRVALDVEPELGELGRRRVLWRVDGGRGSQITVLARGSELARRSIERDPTSSSFLIDASECLVRAEIRTRRGSLLALTNPIYPARSNSSADSPF